MKRRDEKGKIGQRKKQETNEGGANGGKEIKPDHTTSNQITPSQVKANQIK
jgi:hypothetical protein